jgi:type II secretory pathway pseudopilin PulG
MRSFSSWQFSLRSLFIAVFGVAAFFAGVSFQRSQQQALIDQALAEAEADMAGRLDVERLDGARTALIMLEMRKRMPRNGPEIGSADR